MDTNYFFIGVGAYLRSSVLLGKKSLFDQLAQNMSDRNVSFLNSLCRLGCDDQCEIDCARKPPTVSTRKPDGLYPKLPGSFDCAKHVW
jgi:hypothetical protein